MFRRPLIWVALAVLSLFSFAIAIEYFPQAFSIVALDITMTRERALEKARDIMARDGLGPQGFRQAASFTLDEEAQTFVELEGGGKAVFTAMLRDKLYSAYTWRVRQFKELEKNETLITFTPDGQPYEFNEQLKEDAPGAALDAATAKAIAERDAAAKWGIDFNVFKNVESGQERRTGGRVDHTFTYERASPVLNEGRYRLRLVVAGDRLTGVSHFIKIPEAFGRRYESMRSANEAIGIGSVVGLALFYVIGGIGFGLFMMLRKRWLIWRRPVLWGAVVSGLQALATINDWPLMWMSYDTAVPQSLFFAQQIALVIAGFFGFTVFFALSFMAAETLTRRAFGSHPQFWHVWSKEPGSSTAILGRTVAGYLLVGVFFAYDVALYLYATKVLGWWSPAEALLHPDVLASYAPWLSAVANSFQAGFWEEALFRAVPIAGAALIGDRFGKRKLFIIIAFVVQAIIFGSGHAPYPNQPSYARPVELIIPSIGFGLIYLYFGLLPGIILHYTFDVIWFSLPIFLADAPGIEYQKAMVLLVTFIPLWIVLWRRIQVGHWTTLDRLWRNAAWAPEEVSDQDEHDESVVPVKTIGPRARTVWLAAGAIGFVACVTMAVVSLRADRPQGLSFGRQEAEDIARRALEARGVKLGPQWKVVGTPDNGAGGPHEFVSETAGEERRKALVGVYLPKARWQVSVRTFEGDIAERAEQWRVYVTAEKDVRTIQHQWPEGRPGASLDEAAARALAAKTILDSLQLDLSKGHLREISAQPTKLAARTDWYFVFMDTTLAPLPKGEPRVHVAISGDEVTSVGKFMFVPEDWEREQSAVGTRNNLIAVLTTAVLVGLLLTAAVAGGIAWSKRRFTPRLFLAAALMLLGASAISLLNGWPGVLAALNTAAPVSLQLVGVIGIGLVGISIASATVGLAAGNLPHVISRVGTLPDRDALKLGIAAGAVAAAVVALCGWLRTPPWAHAADVGPLGTAVPFVAVLLSPIAMVVTQSVVLATALSSIHYFTSGWSRRRVLGALGLVVFGLLAQGAPTGSHMGPWFLAGLIAGVGLLALYVLLLRADLTLTFLVMGTMAVMGLIVRGLARPYPGALVASFAGAVVAGALAYWWFLKVRKARVVQNPIV